MKEDECLFSFSIEEMYDEPELNNRIIEYIQLVPKSDYNESAKN